MRSLAVKVNKERAEILRREIKEFIREDLTVLKDDFYIYFPVQHSIMDYKNSLTFVKMDFKEQEKRSDIPRIPYDIVGDIAILPLGLEDAERVAEVLLKRKNIRVVLRKASSVEGIFRTREYEYIAGEKRTETIHKENGCLYKLDIEKAYFNPRLSTERRRVIEKINNNDFVIDMFAGVGPFSIPAAKKNCTVVAVDCNRYAIKYLIENKKLNKIGSNLNIIVGDSGSVLSKYNVADHIIMNLPFNTYDFLEKATNLIKKDGIVYFYTFGKENNKEDLFKEHIKKIEEIAGDIFIHNKRIVRSYSPRCYHLCIEFSISNEKTKNRDELDNKI